MLYSFEYGERKGATGANLFYTHIGKILPGRKIRDFWGFVRKGIKGLNSGDVLVTNIGPYAFIFHYLRKIHGKRFRIIRDVQATLHASYIFQEAVCQSMLMPGDAVIFPSHYTRAIYLKLFPALPHDTAFVCYPCVEGFPKIIRKKGRRGLVGYLGRACIEKNFHQLLNIIPEIKRPLLVAGKSYMSIPKGVKYLGEIPPEKVWSFFEKIDLLVFPSTASIESLGRVLLEANHAGVPCVAAEFGASPELCPNLVPAVPVMPPVELLHNHPMGCLDESALVRLLNSKRLKVGSTKGYMHHDVKLLEIAAGRAKPEISVELNHRVQEFIDSTKIYINPKYRKGMVDAIELYLKLLAGLPLQDIGETTHRILGELGFEPIWERQNLG